MKFLVTFLTRYAMIAALGRAKPALPFGGGQEGGGVRTSLLQRWLSYVPAAVLAALVVPATLAPRGELDLGLPALVVLAGTVVAWRTHSVLWTIVAVVCFSIAIPIALRLFNWMTPGLDEMEELKNGNIAVGILLFGFIVAMTAVVIAILLK